MVKINKAEPGRGNMCGKFCGKLGQTGLPRRLTSALRQYW